VFDALKGESLDIALDKGADVYIGLETMLRISEQESLPQHNDLQHLFWLVRNHLEEWCRANIKGRFRAQRDLIYPRNSSTEEVILFRFTMKSEAVRFKLTWGGK
jgi:hypothetical protein